MTNLIKSKVAISQRVLIVDDDPLILSLLENTLQRDGYEVVTALTGREAMELINEQGFAVVLCDINLPDMNGIEVCKQIKGKDSYTERLLISAMTNMEILEREYDKEDIDHVISKPWEELLLRQTVRMAWKKYQVSKEHAFLTAWIESLKEPFNKESQTYVPKDLLFAKNVQEQLLIAKNNFPKGVNAETWLSYKENNYHDFFEVYPLNPTIFDVVLGTVNKNGLPAAFIGALVKSEIYHHENPILYKEEYHKKWGWEKTLVSLEGLFEGLQTRLFKILYEMDLSLGLSIARFNLANRTLNYLSCGIPQSLHFKKSSRTVVPLQNSPKLSIETAKEQLNPQLVHFEVGDLFVFYSPGISQQGQTELTNLLINHANTPDELIKKIQSKQSVIETTEDISLIILKMDSIDVQKFNFLSLTLPSSIKELENARNFIEKLCHQIPGDSKKFIYHLQLVINEIFCNIIEHGYGNNPKGLIIIKGTQTDEGVSLDFFDQGTSFTPSIIPEPILTGDMHRGFGLYIVRESVDRISYTSKVGKNSWNHLHLFKKFIAGELQMQMNHTLANDVLIITPDMTNLDAKFAPEFKEKVVQLITENEANHVVLDLNQVQFIDSSGLGSFLSILRLLHAQGGELKLARIHRPIKTMFELVAMNKIFDIHDQTEDAIAAFSHE